MNREDSNSLKRNQNSQKFKYLDDNNIFNKEILRKLKIINKHFKLEELKQQEKISKFKDGFIDSNEKPKFYFMRSELKIKRQDFIPSTNLSASKRNKTYSTLFKKNIALNGFRNHLGRKIETDTDPRNFEELQSLIETKEIKNNLNLNKYLLSERNSKIVSNNKNLGKKNFKLLLRSNRTENKRILNNKSSEKYLKTYDKKEYSNSKKEEFTKSIILKKSNNYNLNSKDIDNNIRKRPITSRGNRKISKGLIKNNDIKIKGKIKKKKRMIKSSYIERTQVKNSLRENNFKKNNYMNNSNKNISCYTTTFKSYSKSLSTKKKINTSKLFKNIEKQILKENTFFITEEKNEFKSTNQIIKRILNDCNIIDKYIRMKSNERNPEKNDKEDILLKLSERLKKNKLKYLQSKVKINRKVIKDDEKIFKEKLVKVPKIAKNFFREVYKQILFEKRILNKIEKVNIIEAIEEKEMKKKFFNQFKDEVKQKMIITKENFVTEEDDKILLEEQKKLFDFYGNLDGLEWLINKKHIMNFGKNK